MIRWNTCKSLLLVVTTLLCTLNAQSQVFVNQSASGTSDGTSWENAYTNLEDALAQAPTSSDLWIAQGTYTPSTAQQGFVISRELLLYGGFDGTETQLDQRDFDNNLTILNGDVAGDDIAGNFSTNRSDNAIHVVLIDGLLSSHVVIDGFTISNGQTSDDNNLSELQWRGGGIFSYTTMSISNCTFQDNFGRSGASIYISPIQNGGDGSIIENCTFQSNLSSAQSAGIFLNSLRDIIVEDCVFENNQTVRGAFYPFECDGVYLVNCDFINNQTVATTDFGGALWNWNSTNFNITDCDFLNNTAGNGGAIYSDGSTSVPDASNMILTNCTFKNNTTTDFGGGAIYNWDGSYTMNSCVFEGNFGNNGGHVFNGGGAKVVIVSKSRFSFGNGDFGAAMTCYGQDAIYNFAQDTFEMATAMSGGALICGFHSTTNIENCRFTENVAQYGGAIYLQNDNTELNITNATFQKNQASLFGGALNLVGSGSYTINGTTFEENTSEQGGAINASEFIDSTGAAVLSLNNSIFDINTCTIQGAAVSLGNINGEASNCLFQYNYNVNGVAGGALSYNVDVDGRHFKMTNCSLLKNSATVGAGIAQWTDGVATGTLELQNCILQNEGSNYEIEDGSPTVLSSGGNISGDATMLPFLTHTKDQNEITDLHFVDENSDFHLTALSPAVDAGVDTGAPVMDLDGIIRYDAVDAGAYEFDKSVSIDNVEFIKSNGLSILPNPVSEIANIRLKNEWKGEITVAIYDQLGRIKFQDQRIKNTADWESQVMVYNLHSGNYTIVVTNGVKGIASSLIKI